MATVQSTTLSPRNWRAFLAVLSPLLLVLAACSDSTAPTSPPPIVSKAVLDGAHGGTPGFFFLPPLSQDPSVAGAFDSTLAGRLTVEICPIQNGQCGPPVSVFSDTTSEPIVSLPQSARYTVTWRTAGLALTPGTTYRIRTLIDGEELGYADVDLLPQGAPTDAIGVPKVVSGEEMENLPVRGVNAVAAIQGGVVANEASGDINVRGGRDEEVAYFVAEKIAPLEQVRNTVTNFLLKSYKEYGEIYEVEAKGKRLAVSL